jgi:septal ring factor EnvC (AmiA/AmiB activator)
MPNRRSLILVSFIVGLGLIPHVVGQSMQKKISESQKRLLSLKKDIQNYENRIVSESKKEKTELEKLNDINRKIGLLQQLLGELEQARALSEGNVADLKVRLGQTTTELQTLRSLTAQRLLQMYKHREEDYVAYILTSDSWTQAYARMKYLKLIARQDKLDLMLLREKKEQIESQKQEIEYELRREVAIIADKKTEKKRLDTEMLRRKATLGKIRKDKNLFKTLLEEKKDDLETLQTLIVELERKKREQEAAEIERRKNLAATSGKESYKEPAYEEKSTFGLYKGKLPYPVAGKIIQKFGDQINPNLGTRTRNPGIEIQAMAGAQVHAVAKGKITIISWLRRLGNTIIIDHGSGYYTVYAHLSEIYVAPDQFVNAGDTVASVDESDEGKTVLHFEIYRNREAQDPETWLK